MRVRGAGGELLPDAPIDLRARRVPGGWELTAPDGPVRIGPGERLSWRSGPLHVVVAPVRQAHFSRFNLEQGDSVLPLIMLATTVLVLQVGLLFQLLFAEPAGGASGGFEPTPEYLARLLDEQFDGKERGVIAPSSPRPQSGDPIENFYLQPGHDGPRDHLGGGKNVGRRVSDGDPEGKEPQEVSAAAAPAPGAGEEEPLPLQVEASGDDAAAVGDAAETQEEDDKPIAVHVNEGWGLSDWYDTQDAREDADSIREQLKMAHQILRLDPNDPSGLTTRAYYEYLAMDLDAAKRTYDKFTRLYPDEPAGWNNLALVYKRKGEYVREEALYRVALSLDPLDDHALNNLAVCLAHQGRFDEALATMERLEVLTPDDPYADLHRAKIYAAMGKGDRSYHFLQRSLGAMRRLDTLHNIEFRQDIRVDPVFEEMRGEDRFRRLLDRYYGDQADGWWKRKERP